MRACSIRPDLSDRTDHQSRSDHFRKAIRVENIWRGIQALPRPTHHSLGLQTGGENSDLAVSRELGMPWPANFVIVFCTAALAFAPRLVGVWSGSSAVGATEACARRRFNAAVFRRSRCLFSVPGTASIHPGTCKLARQMSSSCTRWSPWYCSLKSSQDNPRPLCGEDGRNKRLRSLKDWSRALSVVQYHFWLALRLNSGV